ncbi:MAG: type 4b pilus protein PilO2 [Alphaproteobacteria bacterium]
MVEDSTETGQDVADNENPPWGATITLGETVYAASLFWQPLQDPSDPLPEINETAEGVFLKPADVYCVRTGNTPQYGLGVNEEGHKSGQVSAAIALAEAFSEFSSFVSVFKVKEGWWFLAVRNDLILSEEDVLYLNEDDAQRAFFSMMAVPDWGRKIAPASWGVDGTIEMDLEAVLANSRQVKLRNLRGIKEKKALIIIGAGALLALWILVKVFGSLFGGNSNRIIAVAPPSKVKKEVQVKETIFQKEEVKKPWEDLAVPDDVLKYCLETINQLKQVTIPGWGVNEFACNPVGVSASWKREWGRIEWLNRSFDENNIRFANRVLSPDGNSFFGVMLLTNVRFAQSTPNLSKTEIVNELNEFFHSVNVPVTVTETKIDRKEAKKGFSLKTEESIVSIKFSFNSQYDPLMWSRVLTMFQGLEIITIRYTPSTNTWVYEGQIYERAS